jgi:predicted peptidase
MNTKAFFGFVVMAIIFSFTACGSDDEITPDDGSGTTPPPPGVEAPPVLVAGAPAWVKTKPEVVYGVTSADLLLETDRDAKVYWVVANKELFLTSEQLKAEAAAPSNGNIKFNGTTDVTGKSRKAAKVTGLAAETNYYIYIVAASKVDNTLEAKVNVSEFKTHKRQEQGSYQSTAESRRVQYLIYKPEDAWKYPDQKFPICFFLGGNGEVAALDAINLVRNGSLAEYISKGNDVPMMVMSIQQIKTDWNTNLIDEGVEFAFKNFPVDLKRVYMTGISGGGFGVWNYAVGHAAKLTAIVPISGGGNKGKACELKNVPIYAFHNKIDGIVNPSNSQNMVDAVNACPPKEQAKIFIFPDEGHDCWRRVYDQNHWDWAKSPGSPKVDIYAWMLSKTK